MDPNKVIQNDDLFLNDKDDALGGRGNTRNSNKVQINMNYS